LITDTLRSTATKGQEKLLQSTAIEYSGSRAIQKADMAIIELCLTKQTIQYWSLLQETYTAFVLSADINLGLVIKGLL
jgi:hypothetical protein